MLNHLVEYAKRLENVEPGFKPKSVRWAAVLSKGGELLDLVELGDVDMKKNPGRIFEKAPDLAQSELVGGSGIRRCHFLAETAEVVALFYSKKTTEKQQEIDKVKAKHDFFVSCLEDASIDVPELGSIARFMANEKEVERLKYRLAESNVKSSDKVTFQTDIGGPFILDSDSWHDWWRKFRASLSTKSNKLKPDDKSVTETAVCLITGEEIEPAATHPKIEGLSDVGGSGMGTVLVGFDKDAFTSYGLKKSMNAPMSEETANAYRSALNHLIKNSAGRLAGVKVVHWYKEKIVSKTEDPLEMLLMESEEQMEREAKRRADELLAAIRTGRRPDLASNRYFSMTLSGSGGRVMVRDWMEGAFEDLVENVKSWFDDLSIVHRDGGKISGSPKFIAVLGATVRELKELHGPFTTSMWRVAVRREPIPYSALVSALHRTSVAVLKDETPGHARMGLIKAFHVRKQGGSRMSDMKPMLNEDHPSSAYHCGRLMAVLAQLQKSALGDVGAGVVQRYYAAASATPALVLGRLARTAQFHLSKLENPGLTYWYEEKLSSVWGRIGDAPPRTLNLEEQSLFALGYYQQLADLRTKKSENKKTEDGGSNE